MLDAARAISRIAAALALALLGASLLASMVATSAFAAAPLNDQREGAIPLALEGAAYPDLSEATASPDDPPSCVAGTPEYASVWYTYAAVEAGPTRISFGASSDTGAIHLLGADGHQIDCDVQPSRHHVGGGDYLEFDAVAGETYLIELASVVPTPGGTAGLGIQLPFGGRPLESIRSVRLTTDGGVRMELDFACPTTTAVLEVFVDIFEETTIGTILGSGHADLNCPRGSTPTATVDVSHPTSLVRGDNLFPLEGGRFVPGAASARIRITAQTLTEAKSWAVTPDIALAGGPTPTAHPPLPPTTTDQLRSGPEATDGAATFAASGLALVTLLVVWMLVRLSMRQAHRAPSR